MRPNVVGTVVAFALCAGAIAYGVLGEARTSRLEALLAQVEAAEDGVPYEGVREMGGSDGAVRLKIASQGGHKRVEFLGLRGESKPAPATRRPPRVPFFNGIPVFLRPGEGRWKQGKRDYGLVLHNYDVVLSGQETVADRAADVIELRALRSGRPSYRIAADAVNRFPLRFQVLQGKDTVFEARFESISFTPKFEEKTFEEKAPNPSWIKVDRTEVSEEQLKKDAASGLWLPASLPAGFKRRGAEIFRVHVDERVREAVKSFLPGGVPKLDAPVVHVNYTDGMALLSVVECPADSELWKFLKRFVPASADPSAGASAKAEATSGGPDGAKKVNGEIVARKFADRRGAAYLMELEGTVVLVAGNVSAEEIEKIIPTFERR